MGNVPWDGTGINCYGMGRGQINMSHGQPWKIGKPNYVTWNENLPIFSISAFLLRWIAVKPFRNFI